MEVSYAVCVCVRAERESEAQSLPVTSNNCILAAKAWAPLCRLRRRPSPCERLLPLCASDRGSLSLRESGTAERAGERERDGGETGSSAQESLA